MRWLRIKEIITTRERILFGLREDGMMFYVNEHVQYESLYEQRRESRKQLRDRLDLYLKWCGECVKWVRLPLDAFKGASDWSEVEWHAERF